MDEERNLVNQLILLVMYVTFLFVLKCPERQLRKETEQNEVLHCIALFFAEQNYLHQPRYQIIVR